MFEPNLVTMPQSILTGDIEEKIRSMYVRVITAGDIEGCIKEIY